MQALGIDLSALSRLRRPLCKGCLDWSVRRSHLAGALTLEAASATAKQASRHYAKRQITWLRHHKISEISYSTQFPEKNLDEILSFIRQRGLTGQA